MTQQIKINKDDLQSLIIYAQRYTIGRMTYAPNDVKNIILKHLDDLSLGAIQIIIDDIEREQEYDRLGEECDKQMWLNLLEILKDEIERRGKK